MAEKFVFCFTNFCTEILLQIFGCIFMLSAIFGTILPNAIAIESFKNYLRKSCSALAPKMLRKLTKDGTGKSY
jgi:hypothetical protein